MTSSNFQLPRPAVSAAVAALIFAVASVSRGAEVRTWTSIEGKKLAVNVLFAHAAGDDLGVL